MRNSFDQLISSEAHSLCSDKVLPVNRGSGAGYRAIPPASLIRLRPEDMSTDSVVPLLLLGVGVAFRVTEIVGLGIVDFGVETGNRIPASLTGI